MKIHSITSSAREQRRWQVEAKRVRDLEVNNQLGFGGLMDRQVGGLLALEDMPRISLAIFRLMTSSYFVGACTGGRRVCLRMRST
jgi:hypothetical protein